MTDHLPISRDSPLPAAVSVPAWATATCLDFELLLVEPRADVTPILDVIAAFRTAAGASMFWSGAESFNVPGLRVEFQDNVASNVFRQRWEARGIAPGGYRVLLNTLSAIHRYLTPLASLRLWAAGWEGETLNGDGILASAYPRRSQTLAFELGFERDPEDAKEPVVRFEFARDVLPVDFDRLQPMLEAWDHLVIYGGYGGDEYEADRERERDRHLGRSQTYMASRDTVEHLLYARIGSSAAFDGLINMASWAHSAICPLRSIEIG